jgi:hypothetical protein
VNIGEPHHEVAGGLSGVNEFDRGEEAAVSGSSSALSMPARLAQLQLSPCADLSGERWRVGRARLAVAQTVTLTKILDNRLDQRSFRRPPTNTVT